MTRRDATENRERVLDAAIAVFAEQGTGASTEVIAERAGVGAGTVFRHFPTKQTLLEAVFERMLGKLGDYVRSRGEERDAGAALFDVIQYLAMNSSTKRAVAETLAGGGMDLRKRAWGGGLREALTALLTRAQTEGAVRDDIGVDEMMGFIAATSRAAEVSTGAVRERTITALLDGLRPRPRPRKR